MRSGIDWKYPLCLELADLGFDYSVLCEFRGRLLESRAERRLFERLLEVICERKLVKARGKQRTDSTNVLAAIRAINRLEAVIETLRHTLNVLAMVAPEWVREHIPRSSQLVGSPYDVEARYSKKRSTSWVGYKVHVTESCEDDTPHVITDVETKEACSADHDALPKIREALSAVGLLPETHLVDTGYVESKALVASARDYEVDLFGPARNDQRWQAKAGEGFEAGRFEIDWERKKARCPAGKESSSW